MTAPSALVIDRSKVGFTFVSTPIGIIESSGRKLPTF